MSELAVYISVLVNQPVESYENIKTEPQFPLYLTQPILQNVCLNKQRIHALSGLEGRVSWHPLSPVDLWDTISSLWITWGSFVAEMIV